MQERQAFEVVDNQHLIDNNDPQQFIYLSDSSSSFSSFSESLKTLFGSFKPPLIQHPRMSTPHHVPFLSALNLQNPIDNSNDNNSKHGLLFYFLNSFSDPDRSLSMCSMNEIWMKEHKWRLHNLHSTDAYSLLRSSMDETISFSNYQRCKLLLLLTSNFHDKQRNSQIGLYLAYLLGLFHQQTSLKYDELNDDNHATSVCNSSNTSSLSLSSQLSNSNNNYQLLFHSTQFLSEMLLTLSNLNISLYLSIAQQQQYPLHDPLESHLTLITQPLITLTQLFPYSFHSILMCLSLFMIQAYPLAIIHQLVDANTKTEKYFIELIENLLEFLHFPHTLRFQGFPQITAKNIYQIMIEYQDKN